MYQIKQYTLDQAKKYNYTVKPSTNLNKKIDVYKDQSKIASIGDSNYSDYPTYIKTHGKLYAENRRILYHKRHTKDIKIKGSNGWLSSILLW